MSSNNNQHSLGRHSNLIYIVSVLVRYVLTLVVAVDLSKRVILPTCAVDRFESHPPMPFARCVGE